MLPGKIIQVILITLYPKSPDRGHENQNNLSRFSKPQIRPERMSIG